MNDDELNEHLISDLTKAMKGVPIDVKVNIIKGMCHEKKKNRYGWFPF
jgi:hypothetical protein